MLLLKQIKNTNKPIKENKPLKDIPDFVSSQEYSEVEKILNDLSYSDLRDIINLNDLGWKRERYTKKRGAIKGGTKGGRPSKKEYIQVLLREENVILPPDLEKKRIVSRQKQISLTEGKSHEIKVDTPIVDSATVSFPKSWIQAEVSHKKNKTELNKARRQKKKYPEKWDTDEKPNISINQNYLLRYAEINSTLNYLLQYESIFSVYVPSILFADPDSYSSFKNDQGEVPTGNNLVWWIRDTDPYWYYIDYRVGAGSWNLLESGSIRQKTILK